MGKEIELSVILPSYLEEENLRILLPRINEVISNMGISSEILVIDTKLPMDGTQEVCEQYNAKYINRENGNYYGDAVRTGIRKSSGKHILFIDADGSHTPEFIPKLYALADDFDVVIASRYIDEGQTENSMILTAMSKILNWTYGVVLNLPCKDVSNSFKIYRRSQISQIDLKCNNFDIVEEILYKINKNNCPIKIKEIPYVFRKRMFGQTKRNLVIFMITYLYTMFRLRLGS
jgi:dolichol-phosphate mannosyltransferase